MKSNTKSKLKIAIPVIILTAVALGLITPNTVNAGFLNSIGKGILEVIGSAVNYVLNWMLKAAASFFEGMLGIGFKNTVKTIEIGWQACRDFANMLFILFMIIIAFGTILRIEKYGVKNLLPKVIGIALLINFSMVFCGIIIDFSNIAADFFIKDIRGNIVKDNGQDGIITATFATAFNVTGTYITFTSCEEFRNYGKEKCDEYKSWWDPADVDYEMCLAALEKKAQECEKAGSTTIQADDDASFLNVFLGYTVGSIIMLIAAFTLFAGGIMLLFRIIAIWFLVTISPLVFMCYILPSMQANLQKWWKTFINWCIFAPAYAFFIWIAIQIAITGANKQWGIKSSQYTISGNYNAAAGSFINSPGEQLISYFIIIGFLIGGLIVAKSLGIYGADAVMKIATDAKKGAAGWLQRQAMRPVAAGGSRIASGALGLTGRLFGSSKLGGRLQARAVQIKQARTQTMDNKKFEALTKTMTDDALLKEIESGIGPRKLVATQTAMSRGLLAKTSNRNSIKKAIKTLEGYGMKKEAGDIRNSRPDIADDIEKTVASVLSKDEQGNWKEAAFEPEEGKKIISAMIKFCGNNVTMFREKFNKLNGLAKKKAIEQMKTMFTNDFANIDNLMVRQRHAAITGNVYDSFKNSSGSVMGGAVTELEKFIKGMKPNDFTGLDPQSAAGIAPYIDAPTAKEILKYISVDMRRNLGANFDPAVKAELRLDDKWKLYII